MLEINPDKESYNIIWEKVIEEEINNYKSNYPDFIEENPSAKQDIWDRYVYFNTYCKKNYMACPEGKIDRHKVAACYMMAIIMSRPMRFDKSEIPSSVGELAINETLAITVGLSLVRAFAISSIKNDKNYSEEKKEEIIAKFKDGIMIPEGHLVNHGSYIENYANELNFNALEGKINILSLAHELYLLEVITKISNPKEKESESV